MRVTLTSIPQVLLAKHWYCPPSALVILVMFSHLSWLISPPPIFDHATNGAGNPITMQFKNTPSPSLTVLLSTWFTDAGTNKIIYNIFFTVRLLLQGPPIKWTNRSAGKYEFIPTDMTFWTRGGKPVFPERSVRVSDGGEKRRPWL